MTHILDAPEIEQVTASQGAAVTLITNAGDQPCCKIFTWTRGGGIKPQHAAQIYVGTAERRYVDNVECLVKLVASMTSSQALTHGVPEAESAHLVTQEALARATPDAPVWHQVPSGSIARDRAHFHYREGKPGVLMLDHDPRVKGQGTSYEEVDAAICEALPAFGLTKRVWRPSSSSFLDAPDGTEIYGVGGWRCHLIVDDASQIPRLGAYIYQRLWAKGYGYIQVSKSGACLDRSLVDASVFQPERLDFLSPPILKSGLTRDRAPAPVILPGREMLVATEIPVAMEMSEWRQRSVELADAKEAARPEMMQKRTAFIEEQGAKLSRKRKIDKTQAKGVVRRAVEHRELTADFELLMQNGEIVTVGDLLSDRKRWHEARCADPLEWDYAGGDRRICYVATKPKDGGPYAYSHAHGGVCYTLIAPEPKPQQEHQEGEPGSPERQHEGPPVSRGLPAHSEQAIALEFVERHKDDLRFTALWKKWHVFAEGYWREDSTLLAFDLASELCRELATSAPDPDTAEDLAAARTRSAVASLARENRRLAAAVDQWDADPMLLCTPRCTIDLRTGEEREHRAGDYITRQTAVSPGGDCQRWRSFIKEITCNDTPLAEYLQRVCGYCLTGDTSEHALFFGWGKGANGKSVFIDTLTGILANYWRSAPIETFTVATGERHPTELAMLCGPRMVTSSETEGGKRWAESRIKQLTGGDTVSARFMRADFFDFKPRFKLLIVGNHKPAVSNVDDAMKRRVQLIPFLAKFEGEQKDLNLPEKLKEEWPGILQWMIDGCADWQEHGLAPPEAVTKATKEYFEDNDDVVNWVEEQCEREGETLLSALFFYWRTWAEKAGSPSRNDKWLREALEARGFANRKTQKGKMVEGLSIQACVKDTYGVVNLNRDAA